MDIPEIKSDEAFWLEKISAQMVKLIDTQDAVLKSLEDISARVTMIENALSDHWPKR